jgi:hypothetical protein
MTFEEFFKRKKIDLTLLQSSEPSLFAEFKNHYEQMGEKSFDHTKKYWFNQLRRRFPLSPEIKTEKIHIENQLAEQTITESLTESAIPAPSVGFKPRFKTAMAPKPAEKTPESAIPLTPAATEEKTAEPAPVAGFKPRFKASMAAKSGDEKAAETEEKKEETIEEKPIAPAVGFKPRFKASMVAKPTEEKPAEPEEKKEEPVEEKPTAPAVGFKPRFKASMVTKPVDEKPSETEEKKEEPVKEKPTEEPAPKPVGFKPRFNAAKMKPKEPGDE